MSVKSQRIKSKQLGMPHGTACARLRKMVFFKLLKQCGEAVCYRCGGPVDSINDISIDHAVPWLHSDTPTELFFDFDNVVFSHIVCNVRAQRRPRVTRKIQQGKLLCSKCQLWKSPEEFSIAKHNSTGKASACKSCRRAYTRLWRARKK